MVVKGNLHRCRLNSRMEFNKSVMLQWQRVQGLQINCRFIALQLVLQENKGNTRMKRFDVREVTSGREEQRYRGEQRGARGIKESRVVLEV